MSTIDKEQLRRRLIHTADKLSDALHCLIEALDEIDGDADLELEPDQEAIDEREPDDSCICGSAPFAMEQTGIKWAEGDLA